ncbi:Lsr2 family protein (plasmid) [Streptomyces sp. NBC_00015]|uniref:histone-like nucleoid-structuring protein Lsr2 n=1 Tax=unclassified Streptomyces TaxID=2593676 RepID=UPI002F91B9FC
MSQKIVTVYTDDLTGTESEEVQTHSFSLDGVLYEIDLASENYDKLFEALEPFIKKGRKLARTRGAGRTSKPSGGAPTAEELRTWARAQGLPVNDRGRVPASIREAYQKTH